LTRFPGLRHFRGRRHLDGSQVRFQRLQDLIHLTNAAGFPFHRQVFADLRQSKLGVREQLPQLGSQQLQVVDDVDLEVIDLTVGCRDRQVGDSGAAGDQTN